MKDPAIVAGGNRRWSRHCRYSQPPQSYILSSLPSLPLPPFSLHSWDLWLRIRTALKARGLGAVTLEWTPSQLEVEAHQRFVRSGNALADVAAGEAAAWCWLMSLKAEPQTDFWDAQASLIRRRARRALVGSCLADPKRVRSSGAPVKGPARARRSTRPSGPAGMNSRPSARASDASPAN